MEGAVRKNWTGNGGTFNWGVGGGGFLWEVFTLLKSLILYRQCKQGVPTSFDGDCNLNLNQVEFYFDSQHRHDP